MRYWSQGDSAGVAETVRLWAHLTACTVSICRLPMYMGMASVLHYAAEASEVFAFLVAVRCLRGGAQVDTGAPPPRVPGTSRRAWAAHSARGGSDDDRNKRPVMLEHAGTHREAQPSRKEPPMPRLFVPRLFWPRRWRREAGDTTEPDNAQDDAAAQGCP